MRDSNGRFMPGHTFSKGHGAPKGNQNAKGHGAPARNTNAVTTGLYMTFEEGETPLESEVPYDRFRGGESEDRRLRITFGYLYLQVKRDLAEAKERLKKARRSVR